jgi:cyclophilin family peptidyl-prolyl cis-trans isomerase
MFRHAAIFVVLFCTSLTFAQTTQPAERKTYTEPPAMKIDVNKQYTATLDTTAGKIVVELFPKEAPKTVNNFIVLSRDSFFNGIIFHRVIPGFMIQGGDPTGTGMGGPGYKFENENRDTTRTYSAGTLGMANAGPDTNGSQFFIMDADTPLPPHDYTIFGQVKDGQDVVHKIATAPRGDNDRPNDPVTINSITIKEE